MQNGQFGTGERRLPGFQMRGHVPIRPHTGIAAPISPGEGTIQAIKFLVVDCFLVTSCANSSSADSLRSTTRRRQTLWDGAEPETGYNLLSDDPNSTHTASVGRWNAERIRTPIAVARRRCNERDRGSALLAGRVAEGDMMQGVFLRSTDPKLL